ncbi:molybdopterin-dependent oxidoreductase [Tessaracoccus sp. G1721]
MSEQRGRWPAVEGLVAVAAGLGAGHGVSALVSPGSSPVLATANRFIDLTPTVVKEWAVATFGTANKPILLVGVLVVVAVLGLLVGRLAVRSLGAAWLATIALGALCAAAALTDPEATPLWALPSALAVLVGGAVLTAFSRVAAADAETPGPVLTRRRVLVGAAGGGVALVGAGLGEVAPTVAPPGTPVLPVPPTPLPAGPAGLEGTVEGVSRLYTPNAEFYRIDTSLSPPLLDHREWKLSVDGMVERPLTLTWDDLLAMDVVEADITMLCVSNPVGGPYVGAARWLGVRVADVLAMAGPLPEADMVLSRSVEGFTISTPIQALTDERMALLAVGMNGEPLPRLHGAPVRMVTPGLYGYVGSMKWIASLTVTTFAEEQAYWTRRGWAEEAPIKPASRIDVPRDGATVPAGRAVVAGVAWAQGIGIAQIEVSIDEGPWRVATAGPDAGIDMWRQWSHAWDATPGEHRLAVRVTDATGRPQAVGPADPFPDGAEGYHEIRVTVSQ